MHRVAILQARMTSTRLPGKVLRPIYSVASLQFQVQRVHRAAAVDEIIVATTELPSDDPVVALADELGLPCHRGSEDDVLERFVGAVAGTAATHVVRLTGDCPLTDPAIIDRVIRSIFHSGADYASNTLERTYPIGMDVEVFTREALEQAGRSAQRSDEREHVTPFIYRNPGRFRLHNVPAPEEQHFPNLRLTLDTEEDLRLISAVVEGLYPDNPEFSLSDVLDFLSRHPDLLALNSDVPHKWLET